LSEFFATPDDLGEPLMSEQHASLGEQLSARALNAIDPQDSPSGGWLYRRAQEAHAGGLDQAPGTGGDVDVFGGVPLEQQQAVVDGQRAQIPSVSMDDARSKVRSEGLDGHLTLPNQSEIKAPVLDLMIQEAKERRSREAAIARGPQGFYPDALGMITSIGAGMFDPVNAAAFAMPVVGEAR
jgi:hypothetical protein